MNFTVNTLRRIIFLGIMGLCMLCSTTSSSAMEVGPDSATYYPNTCQDVPATYSADNQNPGALSSYPENATLSELMPLTASTAGGRIAKPYT
jgi:hypothetical protein